MKLKRFKLFFKVLYSFVLLSIFVTSSSSSSQWSWRERLDVNIIVSSQSLKIINTHDLHYDMYQLETQIMPYVQFTGNPANICMGYITLLIQCSPETVCPVTIPVQNESNEIIIFCSQQNSELHESLSTADELLLKKFSFSPADIHPSNKYLQTFLKELGHPKFNGHTTHAPSTKKHRKTKEESKTIENSADARPSLKRSSLVDSEAGFESAHSVTTNSNFAPTFQHTEQKLIYYLLKNNGEKLRSYIYKALMEISNNPDIQENPTLFFNNIVGLILHVHTRLDVCNNCNDSLVLFREKALSILNAPLAIQEEEKMFSSAAAAPAVSEDVLGVPMIDAPILVTVSSRARNDTHRETMGYDHYWEGSRDSKMHGHIVIQPKPADQIREITLKKKLDLAKIIHIPSLKESVKVPSESGDLQETSANCHSIFPDVLQRFMFEY